MHAIAQLFPRSLEAFVQSWDLTCGQEDAGADSRMGVKVGDEIEAKFVRPVADHDGVGVGTAEKLVSNFQIVVDFLHRGLAAWRVSAARVARSLAARSRFARSVARIAEVVRARLAAARGTRGWLPSTLRSICRRGATGC